MSKPTVLLLTRLALSALLATVTSPVSFGQSTEGHLHGAVFGNVGWSRLLYGRVSDNEVSLGGGFEFRPFAHVGFEFNVDRTERSVTTLTPAGFRSTKEATVFLAENVVFHAFVRDRASPFVFVGFAQEVRESGSGLDAGFGADVRLSDRLSLRSTLRLFQVRTFLSAQPAIVSAGLAYRL